MCLDKKKKKRPNLQNWSPKAWEECLNFERFWQDPSLFAIVRLFTKNHDFGYIAFTMLCVPSKAVNFSLKIPIVTSYFLFLRWFSFGPHCINAENFVSFCFTRELKSGYRRYKTIGNLLERLETKLNDGYEPFYHLLLRSIFLCHLLKMNTV